MVSYALCQSRTEPRCGPPVYCARTDWNLEPYPDTPPLLGSAGTSITDPNFGSRIFRVSDPASDLAGRRRSFMTTASAEQNTWNADSTEFYVHVREGQRIVYDFDPAKMRLGRAKLVKAPWQADPDFSYVRPNTLYGIRYLDPAFQEYNVKTDEITRLHKVSDCFLLQKGESANASLTVSADDQRFSTILGPQQDRNYVIYIFDRQLGCRWYNTQTGEIGGKWGPTGLISAPDRFSIHSSKMSKSGKFVWIDRGESTVGRSWLVWEVDTTKVTSCQSYCGGHLAMGYSHILGPLGDYHPLNFIIRPLNEVTKTITTTKPPALPSERYWYALHISWNHINTEDSNPACLSTYSAYNPKSQGKALDTMAAGENEILCIEVDGKDHKVWRFAHTYSTAQGGFWSTPRGNLSQDGRFYLFTSDWENSLGIEPETRSFRTDVFLVELR